ncbi:MAG: sigma-70 family RNA polymerase sigma factor [Sphingobacteriales bacterium]|nr:MAG: sigma-70 family RNA polymerase sigma factor [Sphingobacteriales bacterium]
MRKPIICDEELITQYLNGNEPCLKMLINRHKSKIFTSIYLLVKDRSLAEDIFQDTFVKIINTLKKGSYQEEGKFLQWAMRIGRNLVIDHFRKLNKLPVVTDTEGNDILSYISIAEENREDEMIREQSHDRVRQLIQQLPEEQKEVLILRHYANLSFKEIAEITGVSINTALGRMRYALTNMRRLIEKHQISL